METGKLNYVRIIKRLTGVVILLSGLYLFSLWHNQADIDDAWIGEHAYWLSETGYAKSELMRGITMQEDYLVVHHKLLVLQGALFIKMFGFSVWTLKSLSLVYFLVFLFLFIKYSGKLFQDKKTAVVLFGMVLIITFPWVFKYSFVFRPEIMLMTITFASWILLEKIIGTSPHASINALFAGLLGGLGFSAHLNGIIIAAAGFLLLVSFRKYRASAWFAAGTLAGMLVYFYDFNKDHGWRYWWMQLSESPALDSLSGISPLLQPFVNLANEHMRFFHNPVVAVFSLFAIFFIVVGFRFLSRYRKAMLRYTLLLALLLGLTAVHKSRQYLLVYFPFLVIMAMDVYYHYFGMKKEIEVFQGWRNHKAVRVMLLVLLAAYFLVSNYHNIDHAFNKFSPQDNRLLVLKYIPEDPAGLKIVAPMIFIFDEIEHFDRIQSDVCYAEMQKSDPTITGNGFLERTKSFDIRYIILSPYWMDRLGLGHSEKAGIMEGFEVLSQPGDQYLVIKRL